jgi:hypothetical protein
MASLPKPYRSPKLAFEVTLVLTRKRKVKGRITEKKLVVLTAHSQAEAEALATSKLWRKKSTRRRYKKIIVQATKFHDSEPQLGDGALNAADRMLGLVQARIHREMYS